MSAQKGHLPVVELLVKHGAQLKVRDKHGLVIPEHIILYHIAMLHEVLLVITDPEMVCYLQVNLLIM